MQGRTPPGPRDKGQGMPFLVLDRNNQPMIDPETGLIRHFATRQEAEAFCKANKGWRVMEVPSI